MAVAEFFTFPGELQGNLERLAALALQAGAAGARAVLFAEACVTGYTPDSPRLQEGDPSFLRLSEIAATSGAVIVAGFLEERDHKVSNTQGAFFPEGQWVLQRKYRPASVEERIANFAPAEGPRVIFEIDGIRTAIVICADFGIPTLWDELAEENVELTLVPTAGCGPRTMGFSEASLDDPQVFNDYLKKAESVVFSSDAIRTARTRKITLATCNQLADDGKSYFHPGHSMIVDHTGDLVALIPGSFVFEHLRPRFAIGDIRRQTAKKS